VCCTRMTRKDEKADAVSQWLRTSLRTAKN